jgi:hypothetical protein
MVAGADRFDRSLFVNCPFDPEYLPLLQGLIFTILECGLEPRLALEDADSGQVRVQKIRDLIRSCRFSVHDISRIEPLREGDLPRFNMPFELGLDLGCRYYGGKRLESKQCLILERERYRYQRVLSDVSGNDIRAHGGDPVALVTEVRNWLKVATRTELPSGSSIWGQYSSFRGDLELTFERLRYSRRDIESLEVVEYIDFIKDWQSRRPASPSI